MFEIFSRSAESSRWEIFIDSPTSRRVWLSGSIWFLSLSLSLSLCGTYPRHPITQAVHLAIWNPRSSECIHGWNIICPLLWWWVFRYRLPSIGGGRNISRIKISRILQFSFFWLIVRWNSGKREFSFIFFFPRCIVGKWNYEGFILILNLLV